MKKKKKSLKMSKADAALFALLVAESDYLTAHGWKPTSILGPSGAKGPVQVWWSRKGATLEQVKAVALQKLEDPHMTMGA